MTPQEILDLPMDPERNGAAADSIRAYLKELLANLFEQGEGFSGKRPFGDSAWTHDLYEPLIKAGLIDGSIDEDGYIQDVDDTAAYELFYAAIDAL